MSIVLSPVSVGLSVIVFVSLVVIRLVAMRADDFRAVPAEKLNEFHDNQANRSDNAPVVGGETASSGRRRSSRGVKSFSAFGFVLLTAVGLAQPGPQYLPKTKSWFLDYNAMQKRPGCSSDPFKVDFAARQFNIVVAQEMQQGRQMLAINPNLRVLYSNTASALAPGSYPTPIYDTLINVDERCFLHGCDPAGLQISAKDGKTTISWLNDQRDFPRLGYRLRVAPDSASLGTLLVDTILKGRQVVINSLLPDGEYLHVSTVKDASHECWYSRPRLIHNATMPTIQHFVDSLYTGYWDGEYPNRQDTIALRLSVAASLTADSVIAWIDTNCNRNPYQSFERFPLTYDAPFWNLFFTKYNTHGNSYGFSISIYHGDITDTLPGDSLSYTTEINNRMREWSGIRGFVTDIGSQTLQNSYISYYKNELSTPDYNGAYVDGVEIPLANSYGHVPKKYDYSDSAFRHGMTQFIARLDTAMEPDISLIQGLPNDTTIIPCCDGGVFESWVEPYQTYVNREGNIGLNVRRVKHRAFLPMCRYPDSTMRVFQYGFYLLISDDSTFYATSDRYDRFSHYPEMNLNLGPAIDTAHADVQELAFGSDKYHCYYRRRFKRGIVYVNPSSADSGGEGEGQTYTIPDSLPGYRIVVSGNTVTPGGDGRTINGGRIYTIPHNGNNRIPPQTAWILLYQPLASPLISDMRFDPPRPTDQGANRVLARVVGRQPLYVEAALDRIQGPLHLEMNDQGMNGDSVPGDSIFTGTFNLPPGLTPLTDTVRVVAYDTTGLVTIQSQKVHTARGGVVPGWLRQSDVPAGPKSKRVKDGGCLAYAEGNTHEYIYGLKGNNTNEFGMYDVDGNSWMPQDTIPRKGTSGRKRAVKKGACMTEADGKLYVVKGGHTNEFWAYDPQGTAGHRWAQKADVPGANVKEGAGVVGDCDSSGIGCVYLLKGSNTCEFYRYSTETDTWENLPLAPAGASGKTFRNGSCLTLDFNDDIIYALKGKTNEFFVYNPLSGTWTTQPALPFKSEASDRVTAAKEGAGLAYQDGGVYATKGGSTLELWRYVTETGQWARLADDVPEGGGKKIKAGGALVATYDQIYALKGNNTLEFYQYTPDPDVLGRNSNSGSIGKPLSDLRVGPNPTLDIATVRYSLPAKTTATVKAYDITGKLVFSERTDRDAVRIRQLPAGVYAVRLEVAGHTESAKLVVLNRSE